MSVSIVCDSANAFLYHDGYDSNFNIWNYRDHVTKTQAHVYYSASADWDEPEEDEEQPPEPTEPATITWKTYKYDDLRPKWEINGIVLHKWAPTDAYGDWYAPVGDLMPGAENNIGWTFSASGVEHVYIHSIEYYYESRPTGEYITGPDGEFILDDDNKPIPILEDVLVSGPEKITEIENKYFSIPSSNSFSVWTRPDQSFASIAPWQPIKDTFIEDPVTGLRADWTSIWSHYMNIICHWFFQDGDMDLALNQEEYDQIQNGPSSAQKSYSRVTEKKKNDVITAEWFNGCAYLANTFTRIYGHLAIKWENDTFTTYWEDQPARFGVDVDPLAEANVTPVATEYFSGESGLIQATNR